MLTLSDLYRQDVEEGTIMVPEYPTSCLKHFENARLLVNSSRYLIDDESNPPNVTTYKVLMPMRIAMVCGSYLHLYLESGPDPVIVSHWERKLGEEKQLRRATFGENRLHITQFPLEDLPDSLHAIDPELHYEIHSKLFIPTIACPQPKVLDRVKLPCVVKTARAAGSEGTWIVNTMETYKETMKWIAEYSPNSEILLTEMIQPIKGNYCVQFYLNKKGEIHWLGVGEQFMDSDGLWCGSVYYSMRQNKMEKLLRPAILPVAEALYQKKYFGVVGIDVLVNAIGRRYVIDINPRINGSTPFLLTTKHQRLRGWDVGVFHAGLKMKMSLPEFVALAEGQENCDVLVFCAAEDQGYLKCQVGVYGPSMSVCQKVLAYIQKRSPAKA